VRAVPGHDVREAATVAADAAGDGPAGEES
jgi:hypothetical protein